MRRTTCSTCKVGMLMVATDHGRAMPVDPDPHPDGNVLIEDGVAHVLHGAELGKARAAGKALRLSHFATCSEPDRYRRSR